MYNPKKNNTMWLCLSPAMLPIQFLCILILFKSTTIIGGPPKISREIPAHSQVFIVVLVGPTEDSRVSVFCESFWVVFAVFLAVREPFLVKNINMTCSYQLVPSPSYQDSAFLSKLIKSITGQERSFHCEF